MAVGARGVQQEGRRGPRRGPETGRAPGHRRGRARWRKDEKTGEYALVADRWHTCFYDLSGSQTLLGQVEGRTADPEYGLKHLLEKNLGNLSPEQFAKVIEALDATGPGQHIALAWIGKEKLRRALNLRARVAGSAPCERQVGDLLFSFYDWCAQNEQVSELTALAATIARWENQIVTAVLTSVTNARSESFNRIARLEARHACGFRNPASQRRRVRTACTRGTRRKTA